MPNLTTSSSRQEEAFSSTVAMLAQYGFDESVPGDLADVVVAARLRGEEPSPGFDAPHAASSKRLGLGLLSSERVYGRLDLPVSDLDKP